MFLCSRYILIVFPFRQRMSPQTALYLVAAIFVLSCVMASPLAIFAKCVAFTLEEPSINLYINRHYCQEAWPSEHYRKLYTTLTPIIHFLFPLSVTGVLYFLIMRKIRNRLQRKEQQRTRTVKVLITVVLVFVLTWLPFHLFALITEFQSHLVSGRYFKFTDALLRVIAMSLSSLNPFLYAWLNEHFREALCLMCRKRVGVMNATVGNGRVSHNHSLLSGRIAPSHQPLPSTWLHGRHLVEEVSAVHSTVDHKALHEIPLLNVDRNRGDSPIDHTFTQGIPLLNVDSEREDSPIDHTSTQGIPLLNVDSERGDSPVDHTSTQGIPLLNVDSDRGDFTIDHTSTQGIPLVNVNSDRENSPIDHTSTQGIPLLNVDSERGDSPIDHTPTKGIPLLDVKRNRGDSPIDHTSTQGIPLLNVNIKRGDSPIDHKSTQETSLLIIQ